MEAEKRDPGNEVARAAKLLLSDKREKIVFSCFRSTLSLHHTHVTCDVTCPGSQRFQNGRQLSTKKNCPKFGFAQTIFYLLI